MLQNIGDGKINALKHLLLGITLRLQNIKPLLDMQHHKQPLMSRCLGTLLLSLLLITGRKKDELVCLDGLVVYEAESAANGNDLSDYVIIACEGSFTRGNASIDLYNPSNGDLLPNDFAEQAGYDLGDILQYVYWTNNLFLWSKIFNRSGRFYR